MRFRLPDRVARADARVTMGPWSVASKLTAALCLGVLLAGCDEPPSVELHEPGVYKGAHDPLLDEAGTDEFRARLRDRMQMVQTDR